MAASDEIFTFLKAIADANRLKMVGLLARQPYTVEQLAAMLGLGASTVSHHLSRLSEAGLVTATAHSYYNYYRLEQTRYDELSRQLQNIAELTDLTSGVDHDAFDRKVVHNFLLPNGRLKTIPGQQRSCWPSCVISSTAFNLACATVKKKSTKFFPATMRIPPPCAASW